MAYTPPGAATAGRGMVVFLHGAGYDGTRTAVDTQFNELAAREGFVVLYPEVANQGCWGWVMAEHQQRDAGQPSLIADITRKVTKDWSIDPRRVWVDGVSCGGAMANVMAATYPDVYAAVGAHASCPYKGSPCFGSQSVASDEEASRAIYQAMGSRARTMPFFAVVGSADPAAPPKATEQTVRSWLGLADLVDDSVYDQSVPRTPSSVRQEQVPGGRAYEIAIYSDADGCVIGESWLIQNMSHAYSGGQNSDRPSQLMRSPDVTTASYAFFVAHPMADRGQGCRVIGVTPPFVAAVPESDVGDLDIQEPLPFENDVASPGTEIDSGTIAIPSSRVASSKGPAPRYPIVWLLPLVLLVVGGYFAHALTNPPVLAARRNID